MVILGIETSCDETAAAVVTDTREILSNVVLSQLEEHSAFGGVVPEIAARAHLHHLDSVIAAALQQAGLELHELGGIAATAGPGLIGGLLVGTVMAKTLSRTYNLPYIPINHLEGHALTPRLTDDLPFPYLLLLVSGGHTQLLVVEGIAAYRRIGTTLDDAAGECFDKVAKLLGLSMPGGPAVEKLAALCLNTGAARALYPLPTPMKGRTEPDFSFSGLKTAVRMHVDKAGITLQKPMLANCFQGIMAEVLADRCRVAAVWFLKAYKPVHPTLVIAGGVSANMVIRSRLEALTHTLGMRLYAPPLSLCGDNAAMIAWAGVERLRLGLHNASDTKARPRWPLEEVTRIRA